MSEYYKIITNEVELDKFLEWLPENKEDEKYMISLFARKKYCSEIKQDKACMKRIVANYKDIKSKLRQLEVVEGCYTQNGKAIPQEALAVYIGINTCSLRKASFITMKKLLAKIESGENANPYKESLNAIQVSSTSKFMIFDLDSKDFRFKSLDFLNDDSYNLIKTRGGYHIIITLDSNLDKMWYQNIMKLNIDQRGKNLLSPIPGCIQGGFTPVFI